MKHLFPVPGILWLAFSGPAMAAGLTVSVNNLSGGPVAAAVVTWRPDSGASIPLSEKGKAFVMAQKNVRFTPYVLAVPAGATVAFPNMDRVNHHVYSFSPVQPFQFPLYGKGKSHTMRFDHPGTVALGCNIHDSMSAYIRVVDTPYYATTGPDGRVTLTVPEGAGRLAVWQPALEAPEHQVTKKMTVGRAGAAQTFSIRVRQAAPMAGQY
jgi:plastocyanin